MSHARGTSRRTLVLAVSAALAGCVSAPPSPPGPSSPPAPDGSADAAASRRNDIVLYAMGLLDRPYRRGGRGPASGFDCSGLVSHVFQEAIGLRVQGSSAQLGQKVRPVSPDRLLPGDLVFFNTLGARHSHVGVYVGDGRFVHASNPRTGVRMDLLGSRYYAQRFEGAGTLLD